MFAAWDINWRDEMKILNKISLRMRITFLTGAILVLCSGILTIAVTYNANTQFTLFIVSELSAEESGQDIQDEENRIILESNDNTTITSNRKLATVKNKFITESIFTLAIVCFLGMGMVYAVTGRSLQPIHKLSKTISEITESDLRYRIAEEGRMDEVGVLGRSFNRMMERLEVSFLRQRHFAANVSHELKTPLTTITSGIQVLKLEDNPTVLDYKETLETTERNVTRLKEVVEGLLYLCNEQDKIDIETVVISEMFESICKELYTLLEQKHINIKINCQLNTIAGNRNLLYRACFNLVENAIKYNKENGSILIEAKIEDRIGKIRITDTGDGISQDELQYIFEPFYRVNKSRSRKTGGVGLGLSIVKAIIEKHEWEIRVDSALGDGSTFTILFNIT